MRGVSIVFVLLFVSMGLSYAQLIESDTLRFGYRLNVNGSWITGNVERLLVNTNLELSHVGETVGLKSSTSYLYGTIFSNKTEDDIFSRNFIYLYPRARFYPYAMFWVQNSKRQQIKFRYQAGFGATYGVFQLAEHHVKLSGTVTYEETRYDGTDFTVEPENLDIDNVTAWRATWRLLGEHHFAGNRLRLHYETWYQPALGDRTNWRYYLNAALDIPFTRHFSLRTALLYTHEQIVLTNIKRDDKILTFGLNWSNF